MNSMKAGNSKAQKLFPRILQVLEKMPESGDLFSSLITEVPMWMFLPWVNQLVGSLHNDKISAFIMKLVENLAKEYPRAVAYPFRTSYEKVEQLSDKAMQYKEKLEQLLELDDLENNIVKNLEYVSVPHIASKDMLKAVTNFKDWYPNNFRSLIQEEYEKFQQVFIKTNSHHGVFIQKFIKEFGAKFDRDFKTLTGLSKLNEEVKAALTKVERKKM